MTASTGRRYLFPLLVVLAVTMVLLASGCMWGFVRDADTGAGLTGATVSYTDAYGHTASTTTGPFGVYIFNAATGPAPAVGPASFQVSKPGYQSLTAPVLVQYNDNPGATLADLTTFWEVQSFDLQFVGGDISTAASPLSFPVGVVYEKGGDLYFSERGACDVAKVDAGTGMISLVAGTGVCGFSGDGGPATAAQLNGPTGLALDPNGDLVIADSDNCRVRKVDLSSNIITTIAGNGTCGFGGDGGAATSASLRLSDPTVVSPFVWSDIAYDASGRLFIADLFNCRIRRVSTGGTITTVAGSGPDGFTCGAFAGDGGPATSARLSHPSSVAVNADGDIFLSDLDNCRIRRVDGGTGTITTIVGNGSCVWAGDGGAPTAAGLANPRGLALDAEGSLFISEFRFVGTNRVDCSIRRIDPTGSVITTLAGSGTCGFSGDGGPATSAQIETPADIALGCDGVVAFAEPLNSDIRVVSAGSVGGPAPDSDGDGVGYVCD